ncbi:lytic polysaccharide monooxygenase auxiliary activity family 9 protein [Streptacidiphilus sp. PAMC 29251]
MPSVKPSSKPSSKPTLSRRRFLTVLGLLLSAGTLAVTAGAGSASAHGSMQDPLSRVEGCYLEGPENPTSAACKAMVAVAGPAPLYDWMSLRIGDADGRSRQIIPDGQLCSAGQAEYHGLDLARADWPATNLTAGKPFTFRFRATAPHKGSFQLFVTNASYDPTKPLTWSNLDAKPFLTVADPPLVDGSYVMPATVPAGLTGRQLIYAIWQRSDSPEAFYSCSDVVFDGSGSSAPAPTPSMDPNMDMGPDPTPSTSPSSAAPVPLSAATPATPAGPAGRATPAATVSPAGHRRAAAVLAETGQSHGTTVLASLGATLLLAGAAIMLTHYRRRTRAGRG